MNHSYEYSYAYGSRYHVWQAVQLAEHAIVSEILTGCKMSVVVDMMLTLVTMRHSDSSLRLRVVVEGNGCHHWQIHQHQQPCKPHTSIVEFGHYSEKPLLETFYKINTLLYIFKTNKHFLS